MKVYGTTDCGKLRRSNQDCYDFWCREADGAFAIVCDGMGGALAGNVASSLAVQSYMNALDRTLDQTVSCAMLQALKEANAVVTKRANEDADCHGMGTTLVAVRIDSDYRASIVNVGDSRAYLIRSDGISKITADHSLVAVLVERGELSAEQARNHPNRNIITRALGAEDAAEGDLYELQLEATDYILLCSDGLSNMVTDQELQYEVLYGGMDETCCRRLIEIALSRGAPDNVTAVLLCVGDGDVIIV